jgi:hypothetical protein
VVEFGIQKHTSMRGDKRNVTWSLKTGSHPKAAARHTIITSATAMILIVPGRIMLAGLYHRSGRATIYRDGSSIAGRSREHALIDLRRIAEHDEANVAHVLLRDAPHVRGGDGVQLVQKLQRVAPAAANQLVLGQL